jgi:site-specific recombinase XerD
VLIHVVVAKGGRQRWAGIGKEYAKHIKAHLRKRKTGIFMQTGTGKVMHRTQVSRTVKLLGQRARLSGRFHPHVLRHCFARDLHDEGWSLEEIRVSLGHKNLNTTQIYLQDLGIDAVMHKLTNRK